VGFHLGFFAESHQTSIVVEVSRRKTNKRENQRPGTWKIPNAWNLGEKLTKKKHQS